MRFEVFAAMKMRIVVFWVMYVVLRVSEEHITSIQAST
jgi:hypothetical protein